MPHTSLYFIAGLFNDDAAFFKGDGTCQPKQWPDKDHGLVCGDCKVLVDKFKGKYKTCNGYCQSIGATCTGAWEEVRDSCKVDREMKCDETLDSSDAICECNGEKPTSSVTTSSGATPKMATSALLGPIQISRIPPQSDMAAANSVTVKPDDHSSNVSQYYPLVAMICVSLVVITGIIGGLVYVIIRRTAKRSERVYAVQMFDADADDVHDASDIIAEGDVIEVFDGNGMHGPLQTDDHTSSEYTI